MSQILVYIESSADKISKSSLPVISAALQAKEVFGLSRIVGVLLGGDGTRKAADEVSSFGLDEVLVVSSSKLNTYLADEYSQAFLKAAKEVSPSLILAPASSKGRDFLPRVAFLLDAPQASDVIGFVSGGNFKRPMYAGNLIAEVELVGAIKTVTVRTSAFSQPSSSGSTSQIREINVDDIISGKAEFVSFDTVKNERPELGEADMIVSGGRALKSSENFQSIMYPLADVLGAAIGASRAAVDAGYAPNDWQVGQTGKIVAPKLYIAVGISGAVQHLAGMKDSKTIVAINKDPEAPIFEIATYGLVADLYQVVPELIEKLKVVKNS